MDPSPRKATYGQIKLIIRLMAEANLSLTSVQLRKLRNKTSAEQAHAMIEKLKAGDASGMGPQIDYLVQLRKRAHQPVTAEELEHFRTLDTKTLNYLTQQAMRAVHAWDDDHGKPIVKWRMDRGFYTQEVLERNGSYNMPKVKTRPAVKED